MRQPPLRVGQAARGRKDAGVSVVAPAPAAPSRPRRAAPATETAPKRKPNRRRPATLARPRAGRSPVAPGVLWVLLIAVLLGGIVALNVGALRNSISASKIEGQEAALRSQNDELRSVVAEQSGLGPHQRLRGPLRHDLCAAAAQRLPASAPAEAHAEGGDREDQRAGEPAGRQSGAVSKQSDQRLRLIMFVFAAAFAVVIGRALYVQILQASALAARAHGQQNSTTVVPTSRGRILDATGKTLAVDVPAKDLMVDPSKVQDPGQVASYIAQKLGYQIKHKKAFKKEVQLPGRPPDGAARGAGGRAVAARPRRRRRDHVGAPAGPVHRRLRTPRLPVRQAGLAADRLRRLQQQRHARRRHRERVQQRAGRPPRRAARGARPRRRPAQHGHAAPRPAGPRRPAHDRSLHPAEGAVGAGRDREPHGRAQRHRAGAGSAQRLDPGDGDRSRLRQQRRPRPDRQAVRARHPQHGGRVLLRARLDLQGGDDGRRADGGDRHAADAVPDPVRDQGRRPDRARRRRAPDQDVHGRPDPAAVVERGHGHDRRARAQAAAV